MNNEKTNTSKKNTAHPLLIKAKKQLQEYFNGKRTQFTLPIEFEGTAFQQKVWDALLSIPYGKTVSYSDIAKKIKKPSASRAVGMAIGRNPLSIIVPCHRVIGANGTLTGYAGGLPNKAFLLELESH